MSISVNNLSKIYGHQKAIDDLTFEIAKGQVVGFLGPNGAGKSTTMKILTCFMPQTSGTAQVAGFDTAINPIEVRRHIGYLPEHNPLYLDMYVKEYLAFIGDIFAIKNKSKRIAECIEMTGLGLEQKKKIGQLSKGYRQRVGLAQALIHNPSVLILDEPTSGLDPNQVAEIRKLIKTLGQEKTVMLSTHQLTEVEAVCDRAIIINLGKIVADQSTASLKTGLNENIVIDLVFNQEVDINQLKSINGIQSVEKTGNQYIITAKKDANVQATLWEFAVKNNLSITTLSQRTENLEEVFKNLTKNVDHS